MADSKVEVWGEDNYDYMKGSDDDPFKVAEFQSIDEAVTYMRAKLDKQLSEKAKGVESADELIRGYKFGGVNYFVIGGKGSLDFSSWKYVEQNAHRIFEDAHSKKRDSS